MIIALCGQKGGSGKSLFSIAITAELMARGRRVLLVDADPQGTSRTWVGIAREKRLPSPDVVQMAARMFEPTELPAIAPKYDDVVIDCPPRYGDVQAAALMVADLAVLPCGPAASEAWAMDESAELVKKALARRGAALYACALITKKRNTKISDSAREVLGAVGLPVLSTEFFYRVAYEELPASGMGIADYAPDSPAASEVRSLVDELEEVYDHQSKGHHRAAKAAKARRR